MRGIAGINARSLQILCYPTLTHPSLGRRRDPRGAPPDSPIFGGRGLEFGGGAANSLMYLLFVAAVVAVLVAMGLVFWGAVRRKRAG